MIRLAAWSLVALVAAAVALPAVDDCNGSAGALNGNWTIIGTWTYTGSGHCVSNTVSADAIAKWTGDSFTSDHYAQTTLTTGHSGAGPAVRLSGTTAGNMHGYFMVVVVNLNTTKVYANDGAGGYTLLSDDSGNHTPLDGEVAKLQAVGTAIDYWVGSRHVSFSDSTWTSGGVPGLFSCFSFCSSNLNDFQADNVGGATFPAAIINALIRGGGLFQSPQEFR